VSTFDKVVGWFVIRDEDTAVAARPQTPSAESASPTKKVAAPGEPHDAAAFAEVYASAGISAIDQERVMRAIRLVRELPAETPIDVRRAIVAASMKAFEVPVDGLRVTAVAQLKALDAYATAGASRTAEIVADAHERIARLEAQIAEIRSLIELQKRTQDELVRATEGEKGRLRALDDFFGGA
jgi:hypothetical protein